MLPVDFKSTVTPCLYREESSHLPERKPHRELRWAEGKKCRTLVFMGWPTHVSLPTSPEGYCLKVVVPPTELQAPVCTVALTVAATLLRPYEARFVFGSSLVYAISSWTMTPVVRKIGNFWGSSASGRTCTFGSSRVTPA